MDLVFVWFQLKNFEEKKTVSNLKIWKFENGKMGKVYWNRTRRSTRRRRICKGNIDKIAISLSREIKLKFDHANVL